MVINKTVTLIGENSGSTFIDGNGRNVVCVTADNAHISGFTMQNGSSGIWLTSDSSGNTITGNTITSNKAILLGWGIIVSGVDNIITSNMITSNWAAGILLDFSENATIVGNTISNNTLGVMLVHSRKTALSENTITSNYAEGVGLYDSSDNTILDNTISNHEEGIRLWNSSDNTIYHNSLINNRKQARHFYTSLNANTWDNGAEGNYWSDYAGEDLNGDGIGDTDLPHQEVDNYPLIIPRGPIPAIWDGVIYPVSVLSNSTVSRFDFSHSLKQISFNVTGPDGTTGFCRVAIPKQLLSVGHPEEWIVMVGNDIVVPEVSEDENYTYLYFIYLHSTKTVTITGTRVIPEFPTWTQMLLILILLTIAIAIYKRRLSSKSFH